MHIEKFSALSKNTNVSIFHHLVRFLGRSLTPKNFSVRNPQSFFCHFVWHVQYAFLPCTHISTFVSSTSRLILVQQIAQLCCPDHNILLIRPLTHSSLMSTMKTFHHVLVNSLNSTTNPFCTNSLNPTYFLSIRIFARLEREKIYFGLLQSAHQALVQ